MLLKYFYHQALAQASYMVGCQATGEALVIDPARDIQPYVQAAQQAGLRITHVTETHIHADFVSGVRELAAHSGAQILLSAEGGADWAYDYESTALRDGDRFMVGNIRLDVLHTPGHTPEHLIFMLTDTAGADSAMGLFTGDLLFVGDIGRPDLLEEAAGIAHTREPGARQQFRNLQRLKTLPDYLQVWPGHGAGSACGKALGAIPSTTLGYEKLFNRAFQFNDENAFVDWLLQGQPEAPRYFGQMKRVNKTGPALLQDLREPLRLDPTILPEVLKTGALVIDTRAGAAFARGHIPGTLHIPAGENTFSTYAGWYVDFRQPTYLIAAEDDAERIVRELRAVGVDNIPGYFTPDVAEKGGGQVEQITVQQAAALAAPYILDVRSRSEYEDGHIPAAQHIAMGYVPRRLHELPRDRQIIVQCGAGVRSMIVASLLAGQGLRVINLVGGIDAWKQAGLPLEKGIPESV
ncbi:MAG: MBL fold metallo-hydrolase [Chloroflexi bacterium]|nr:MBL fold metallo-hydrolase [Chloroflexota bacterium]